MRLVAAYAGIKEPQISVGSVEDVEFEGPGRERVCGSNTAARHLASQSAFAAALLGEDADQQAKVAEWLAFRHTKLTPLMDDALDKLNQWLLTRTYLAGGAAPSLADLVLYAAVAPAAAAFPVAQHGHFCNLLRWYDLLHHTADSQALYPAATFAKPPLVPPPPPAPAAAVSADKQAASAGAAKGKAAKGKGEKHEAAAAAAAPAAAQAPTAAGAPAAAACKKERKKKGGEAAASPATPAASATGAAPAVSSGSSAAPAAADSPTVDLLDIRVGRIVKVGRHPNAESLYLEEIDLGEEKARQVISGLVKFVPEAAMLGRRVVVVTNLKPAKMRDVMSYGMVLCASNADHTAVDPITPPEGVPVGEKIAFEGYTAEPEPVINPKKKQFEKIAPDLTTDANGLCTYRGVPFMTSQGPVTATIPNAHIA